jgi:hypothetical protein
MGTLMRSADGTTSGILERSQQLHQELLALRVASARSRHEAALAGLQQAITDNHPDGDQHAGDWQRILEARVVEADALSEYISALRAYSAAPAVPLQVV